MAFIVVELQKLADGNVANIVTQKDTENEAYSHYHSVLAAAAVSELPCHSAVILSDEGFPVAHQCYKHG